MIWDILQLDSFQSWFSLCCLFVSSGGEKKTEALCRKTGLTEKSGAEELLFVVWKVRCPYILFRVTYSYANVPINHGKSVWDFLGFVDCKTSPVFPSAWGWVDNDWAVIFVCIIPLTKVILPPWTNQTFNNSKCLVKSFFHTPANML